LPRRYPACNRPVTALQCRSLTINRMVKRIGMLLVVVAVTAGVVGAPPVRASVTPAAQVVKGAVGEFDYEVLLPSGYERSDRRYPVVYIITGNGGAVTSAATELHLDEYAARDEAIIVTPVEHQLNNLMPDWADGSRALDHDFISELIPRIDADFRTIPDRDHRAIAGLSAGGYSSMAIAAHHPNLFAAAASFSGLIDIRDRGAAGEATVELPQVLVVDQRPDELFHRFGNPYTDPESWVQRNPTDLVANLRGVDLYASAGDGVPASADEAAGGGAFLWQHMLVEQQISSMTVSFIQHAQAAGIPIDARLHRGTHDARHWRDDLADWWPRMLHAFE